MTDTELDHLTEPNQLLRESISAALGLAGGTRWREKEWQVGINTAEQRQLYQLQLGKENRNRTRKAKTNKNIKMLALFSHILPL